MRKKSPLIKIRRKSLLLSSTVILAVLSIILVMSGSIVSLLSQAFASTAYTSSTSSATTASSSVSNNNINSICTAGKLRDTIANRCVIETCPSGYHSEFRRSPPLPPSIVSSSPIPISPSVRLCLPNQVQSLAQARSILDQGPSLTSGISQKPTQPTKPSPPEFTAGCTPRNGVTEYGCYCGAGYSCKEGFGCTPTDRLDAACRLHDMEYGPCNFQDHFLPKCAGRIYKADVKLCSSAFSLGPQFRLGSPADIYRKGVISIFCTLSYNPITVPIQEALGLGYKVYQWTTNTAWPKISSSVSTTFSGGSATVTVRYPSSSYIGNFDKDANDEVMSYTVNGGLWRIGDVNVNGKTITFKDVGQAGFGDLKDGKHRVWVGNFDSVKNNEEILMHSGADGNWFIGAYDHNPSNPAKLEWDLVGNTKSFGNLLDGKHVVEIGDFNKDSIMDVLMYYSGDGNWWLVTIKDSGLATTDGSSGTGKIDYQMSWTLVGNTKGFGNLADNSHLTQVGDFDGDGREEIAMYYSADGNWWVITLDNVCKDKSNRISWCLLNNSKGFGNLLSRNHLIKFGNFYQFANTSPKTTILFNNVIDGNWWLGILTGSLNNAAYKFGWKLVGNTKGFGNLVDFNHFIEAGKFAIGRDSIVMYSSKDGDWWLATIDPTGSRLLWNKVANTRGFANLAVEVGAEVLIGDVNGDRREEILSYPYVYNKWYLAYFAPTGNSMSLNELKTG